MVSTITPSLSVPRFAPVTALPAARASLADTYAGPSTLSISEGAVAGAAIGAGLGTVGGAIVGGVGTVGAGIWAGARFGGGAFGLPGAIVGGIGGGAVAALEERYLGVGTKVGAVIGFGAGTVIGGIIGGIVGIFT